MDPFTLFWIGIVIGAAGGGALALGFAALVVGLVALVRRKR